MLKVVYFNNKELASLGVLFILFKAIELKEVLREDTPTYLEAIN
jgi:hypothetical protein